MIAYCVIFALVVLIVTILVFYRRPTVNPSGQPTGNEAKIISIADKERQKIQESTPSGAAVRRLSDEDLERELNDHRSTD